MWVVAERRIRRYVDGLIASPCLLQKTALWLHVKLSTRHLQYFTNRPTSIVSKHCELYHIDELCKSRFMHSVTYPHPLLSLVTHGQKVSRWRASKRASHARRAIRMCGRLWQRLQIKSRTYDVADGHHRRHCKEEPRALTVPGTAAGVLANAVERVQQGDLQGAGRAPCVWGLRQCCSRSAGPNSTNQVLKKPLSPDACVEL
mmetsp:Transcript_33229/g.87384  ORF Transcript_33229/g.87384 Transcript_33229/m.87384 type:complete len:202 (-) Transcript_33229:159-764(-)